MKVLILEPRAAYAPMGGFAPLVSDFVVEEIFSGKNREDVFPESVFSHPQTPHQVARAFDQAIICCDVVIALCTESSFQLGVWVERALARKKLVCALIPNHLKETCVEYGIRMLYEWGLSEEAGRPITFDYFPWIQNGFVSKIQAISRCLASVELAGLVDSRLPASA